MNIFKALWNLFFPPVQTTVDKLIADTNAALTHGMKTLTAQGLIVDRLRQDVVESKKDVVTLDAAVVSAYERKDEALAKEKFRRLEAEKKELEEKQQKLRQAIDLYNALNEDMNQYRKRLRDLESSAQTQEVRLKAAETKRRTSELQTEIDALVRQGEIETRTQERMAQMEKDIANPKPSEFETAAAETDEEKRFSEYMAQKKLTVIPENLDEPVIDKK